MPALSSAMIDFVGGDPTARQAVLGAAARIKTIARRYADRNPIDLPDGGNALAVLGSVAYNALDPTLTKTWSMNDSVQGALFDFTNGAKVRYTSQYLTCWSTVSETLRNVAFGLGDSASPSGSLNTCTSTKRDFLFDGPLIALQYGAGFNGVVLIDGQFVSRSHYSATAGGGGWLTITIPGPRKLRRITIIDFLGSSSLTDAVQTTPGDTIAPAPRENRIVMGAIGDSFTAASNASERWMGFANQLGMMLGGIQADVRNMGIGGTGYEADASQAAVPQQFSFVEHVGDIGQATFDLIVVAGGINDPDSATLQDSALTFFQALRARAATPLICVTGSWSGNESPNAVILSKEAKIKAAFDQWGDSNSVFVPVSADPSGAWVTGDNAVTIKDNSNDNTHPGDYGHFYLARRLRAALLSQLG